MTTIHDIKIRELIDAISENLDIDTIINFHLAISYPLTTKWLHKFNNSMKHQLEMLQNKFNELDEKHVVIYCQNCNYILSKESLCVCDSCKNYICCSCSAICNYRMYRCYDSCNSKICRKCINKNKIVNCKSCSLILCNEHGKEINKQIRCYDVPAGQVRFCNDTLSYYKWNQQYQDSSSDTSNSDTESY